jgi:hypothetical protein
MEAVGPPDFSTPPLAVGSARAVPGRGPGGLGSARSAEARVRRAGAWVPRGRPCARSPRRARRLGLVLRHGQPLGVGRVEIGAAVLALVLVVEDQPLARPRPRLRPRHSRGRACGLRPAPATRARCRSPRPAWPAPPASAPACRAAAAAALSFATATAVEGRAWSHRTRSRSHHDLRIAPRGCMVNTLYLHRRCTMHLDSHSRRNPPFLSRPHSASPGRAAPGQRLGLGHAVQPHRRHRHRPLVAHPQRARGALLAEPLRRSFVQGTLSWPCAR